MSTCGLSGMGWVGPGRAGSCMLYVAKGFSSGQLVRAECVRTREGGFSVCYGRSVSPSPGEQADLSRIRSLRFEKSKQSKQCQCLVPLA